MHYISSVPTENQNYGNPHNVENPGDYMLLEELLPQYLATMGFALLGISENTVVDIQINQAAYDAYIEAHPVIPTPPSPTEQDLLEAQILYTAAETDTLLPDWEEV